MRVCCYYTNWSKHHFYLLDQKSHRQCEERRRNQIHVYRPEDHRERHANSQNTIANITGRSFRDTLTRGDSRFLQSAHLLLWSSLALVRERDKNRLLSGLNSLTTVAFQSRLNLQATTTINLLYRRDKRKTACRAERTRDGTWSVQFIEIQLRFQPPTVMKIQELR